MRTQDIPAGILPGHAQLYYGGQWHAPLAGTYADTINPCYNEVIMAAPVAGAADVHAAVLAADAAFPAWSALPPRERAGYLRKAASILREHAMPLARLDSLNNGNPVSALAHDAAFAADCLDYFAGLATEIKGETIPLGPGNLNYTSAQPLGVIARIVAYNHPLMFAAARLAAPLAAGNTVVIKAPDQAPLSILRLAELVGPLFPAGVVNFLCGTAECGDAMARHPLVRKVTLIGGVPTGRAVMKTAADSLKPVLLELGGKNALIAYPDADRERLIDGIIGGMNFTWSGQSCGSTSRVFLHESLHDEVLTRIAQALPQRHKPGIPTDPATTMGSLVSRAQLEKVERYVAMGLQDGARLVCGGKRPDAPALREGFFYEPTVFADMQPSMRLAREEVFGPIMSVFKWSDEDRLFEAVNGVDFGLTGSIWTRDLDTAHRAAQRMQTGYVWINNSSQHFLGAPFGGVKQSGIGREECFAELLEFTYTKNVNLKFG
ncbi:aldehyde dehydrogenase family protein [Bordetella hinzii]|uniref:Aldehyde dehydrogenase n=1 Tax=Bordetella hinzii TaxID=103855 RepID=A0AAN1RTF0_9BORD|nr:aldehyde dehydrogenase family protein [Bordetella hinzii]AKQ59445.1 2-formylbenzoate dehydrogenase [Bordetella hinzii]AZW15323.1 aldehyde dehydrogenase [Bordetella hinzii]KCB41153.1 putative betaine-aldehyde dehydrogenase [Bordetella hinzii 4161]KXA72618.1 aldehyde dehydrogenase [Bordetella hinzii LMG 13501]MBZ0073859.1 aldehyde dehydrogenase family protein [Bordetella hinzii]